MRVIQEEIDWGLFIGGFGHGLLDDDDKVSYGVFKVQHLLQKSNNTRSFKTLISNVNGHASVNRVYKFVL